MSKNYSTKLQTSLSKIALVYHIKIVNIRLVNAMFEWLGMQPNNNQLVELKYLLEKSKISSINDVYRWIMLNHKKDDNIEQYALHKKEAVRLPDTSFNTHDALKQLRHISRNIGKIKELYFSIDSAPDVESILKNKTIQEIGLPEIQIKKSKSVLLFENKGIKKSEEKEGIKMCIRRKISEDITKFFEKASTNNILAKKINKSIQNIVELTRYQNAEQASISQRVAHKRLLNKSIEDDANQQEMQQKYNQVFNNKMNHSRNQSTSTTRLKSKNVYVYSFRPNSLKEIKRIEGNLANYKIHQ